MRSIVRFLVMISLLASVVALSPLACADETLLTGAAALDDWHGDAPGVRRHITPTDLPVPFATGSASPRTSLAAALAGALPKVPQGFSVARFASGFDNPRVLRVAPNGDIFLAETGAGRIRVLRAPDGAAEPMQRGVFVEGLEGPFGMAFYPPGPAPKWLYVAENNRVLRFAYQPGQLAAKGDPEIVVAELSPTSGGHSTRDLRFSPDGKRMYVSVGSQSNVADGMAQTVDMGVPAWEAKHGLGATWDSETNRANVLVFDPDDKNGHVYATGLRNCAGLGVYPMTGDVWCATNERDALGDNLPPDYATRLREGAFYGWPWYYVGGHEEPRLKGARPDLNDKVTLPDVLFQAHSAPLQILFYQAAAGAGSAFPPEYNGDAFVALHGSWNRSKRTGYKIVRLHLKDGVPNGEYEDFLTGFVLDDSTVWGRPVGLAVAHDGALLVGEDGNNMIWRVTYNAK